MQKVVVFSALLGAADQIVLGRRRMCFGRFAAVLRLDRSGLIVLDPTADLEAFGAMVETAFDQFGDEGARLCPGAMKV